MFVQDAVASILAVPEGQEVVVIGTVYKDMKLKPSILDEYVKVSPLAGSFYFYFTAAAPPCQVHSKDVIECGCVECFHLSQRAVVPLI